MNRIATTLYFILCLNFASSQKDSIPNQARTFEIGARSGFYGTAYLNGLNYYSVITLSIKNHEFSIGPSFGRLPSFYPFHTTNYDKNYRLNGIDLSYRILPNGKERVFDFYFQLNYFQKWGEESGVGYVSNFPNLYDYTQDNVQLRSVASQLLLEYGFEIKFFKYFYVGTSVGFGGRIDFRNYKFETYPQLNYKEQLIDPDVILRTSFGFRF